MGNLLLVGLLCLWGTFALADPVDDYLKGDPTDAYETAKMFAWCSAQFDISAALIEGKDTPGVPTEINTLLKNGRKRKPEPHSMRPMMEAGIKSLLGFSRLMSSVRACV